MSTTVMLAVLLGALLHAGWNALVRGASDGALDIVLVVVGAGAIAAFWLPFASIPAAQSWPHLGASVIIHVVYFRLVALAYRQGQLSFAYPLMRGTAPAISAAAAALLLNELPSPAGWSGVILICCGVMLLAADSWRAKSFHAASAMFALVTAGVIVIYTLVDGVGVRLSGHPASYTGWMFLLTALSMAALSFARDGAAAANYLRRHWRRGLIGGACTFGSYALALWAMTHAPIALVAALRETSVVFALIIAAIFLRERISLARYLSVLVIIAGAVAIKIS